MRQRLATGGQRTLPPSGDPRTRDCRKRNIDQNKNPFSLSGNPEGSHPPLDLPSRASQPLIILRKETTSPNPPATRLSSSAEGANCREYLPRDQNSCGLQTSPAPKTHPHIEGRATRDFPDRRLAPH